MLFSRPIPRALADREAVGWARRESRERGVEKVEGKEGSGGRHKERSEGPRAATWPLEAPRKGQEGSELGGCRKLERIFRKKVRDKP